MIASFGGSQTTNDRDNYNDNHDLYRATMRNLAVQR